MEATDEAVVVLGEQGTSPGSKTNAVAVAFDELGLTWILRVS